MKSVFVVQHVHELPSGEEDVKFIGVYSSMKRAEAAVLRLSRKPGFIDHPTTFHIDEYELDTDHWVEGFVTLDQ